MDQLRALRLLQCAWLSSDRGRLVLPLDTVAGVLVTQTASKPTALKLISKLPEHVPIGSQSADFFPNSIFSGVAAL